MTPVEGSQVWPLDCTMCGRSTTSTSSTCLWVPQLNSGVIVCPDCMGTYVPPEPRTAAARTEPEPRMCLCSFCSEDVSTADCVLVWGPAMAYAMSACGGCMSKRNGSAGSMAHSHSLLYFSQLP